MSEEEKSEDDFKYQEKIGEEIDRNYQYQKWLKENKKVLNDPKYILYRLPLTHKQREKIWSNLMKEAELKKEMDELKDNEEK